MPYKALLLLSLTVYCEAYRVFLPSRPQREQHHSREPINVRDHATRRSQLQKSVNQILLIWTVNLIKPPRDASAAVGEGGLPEVTEAFQRLIRSQKEWNKIGETINKREGKLDEIEWKNTQIFLRNTYMVGEDMRRIVRDAERQKRDKGTEIAKAFQRLTLDMDKPAKAADYQGFLQEHAKGTQAYKDFLDVISDVPDEL